MDLNDCFSKGLVRKAEKDEFRIMSLMEMADIKEEAVKEAKITEKTISAYVSLAYDALREVLEALCLLKGYKVLSHICIGELLADIIDDFDYDEFDRIRWIRNSINYYGEKIDFEQGMEIIDKIFAMKKEMASRYLKRFKE
ncbi:MAG: hypothetical protein GXO64_02450 [Candidatus Micrarchaeota archaeon]|nr:hypothetical protein [Candidatus Micrarchaeota archaeon]